MSANRSCALLPMFVGVALALGGCAESVAPATCVRGQQISCACAGGTAGYQICASDGSYGACVCPTDAGSDAATASDGALDASLDASADGSLDASVDASLDASLDGALDASLDGALDASGGDAGPCNLATDTDLDTITFDVTTLQVPRTATGDGFDLDGVRSDGSTVPIASDAAGCFWSDLAPVGGVRNVDNQLASVNAAASVLGLDLSKGVQDAVTSGGVKLRVVIGHWNNTLTDGCVSVDVQTDTGSGFLSLGLSSTSLTNGITPIVAFAAPLALTVSVTLPTGTSVGQCTPGTYSAAQSTPCGTASYDCTTSIPLTIEGVEVRAHIVADAAAPGGYRLVTNTPNVAGSATVATPSILAGHLLYWDTSAGRPACSNTAVTGTTFEAAMQKAICDLGQGTLWGQACPILAQNLDLHDQGGALNACAAGGTKTTSNANSLSLGLYVGN